VTVNEAVIPAPNPDIVWEVREQAVMSQPHGRPNVVFLGDSIFDRFQHGPGVGVWRAHLAPLGAKDLAVTSSTTENVLWLLDQGILGRVNPGAVVLMIGTNNLKEDPAEVAQGVATVVAAVRARLPHAGIVLFGLLPRGADPHGVFRTEVPQVNRLIAPLGALPRVHYMDVGSAFLNRDGTIKERFLPDFIHPDRQGYVILYHDLRGPLSAFLGHKVP
jgi:lysophospholipase L1-like esterase